jgi:L-aspartate oxidase
MGGIAVDAAERAKLAGLWPCGEAAGTGLHSANRLASNSLPEAIVSAGWVADSIAATSAGRDRSLVAANVSAAADPEVVRPILSRAAGVLRAQDGLASAIAALLPVARSSGPAADRRLSRC